jgi:hypothetical protein
MAKSLFGKNPDLDDVDFIETIEGAFGISFRNEELETWSTFGDVFDTTCHHMQAIERGPIPCLSATAYRRIRKAILKDQPDVKVRPDTPLKTLLGGRRGPAWCRALQRDMDLQLPDRPFTAWSLLLFLVTWFGIPIAGGIGGLPIWMLILSPILGVFLGLLLRPSLPVQTVGDLARAVAALNPKALSHGAIRTRDVWSSLVWIARDNVGFTDPIERETVLIG